jgi:uncharacterized protein with FMN-binding domain
MKKVLSIIILIVFLFLLYACANSENIAQKIPLDKEMFNSVLMKKESGEYYGEYIHNEKFLSVKLNVIISENSIKEIIILEHKNGLGKNAESIIYDVIQKNSLDVDIVSGATYSSRCILKAIENALK